jgi:hypothetical protein
MRGRWDDPYFVLGLPKTATELEIRRAFRQLALRDHPDRNPGDAEAARRFTRASAAYQRLKESGWKVYVPDERETSPPRPEPRWEPRREAPPRSADPFEPLQDPLPETWPDGSPIHYPTPEEIAEVIAAVERPKKDRFRYVKWGAFGLTMLMLFALLDRTLGTVRIVKGTIVSQDYVTRTGYTRFGNNYSTVPVTVVSTEYGEYTFGEVPSDLEVEIHLGYFTGYPYAEPVKAEELRQR